MSGSGKGLDDPIRDLADHVRAVLWVVSPDGDRMLYCSPAYERLWGRPVDALLADPSSWLEGVHPGDRARVDAAWARRLDGYEAEYRVVRPDGSVINVHDRGEPVRDEAGEIVRLAGFTTDITDVRRLEEQLRHAQKMESLGRLAGGVAHEVNNLLTILLGHARLARQAPDDATAHIADIEEAARRGGELTARLLGLTPSQPIRSGVLDLAALVRGERGALRTLAGPGCALTLACPAGEFRVRADAVQVRRMLADLVRNAIEAMPAGGELEIGVAHAEYSDGDAARRPALAAGAHVVLTVTDTGPGIPVADRSRVFEPFFTTKRAAPGMGLTTAYGVLARCGGHIALEDGPRGGTRVVCSFPLADIPVPVAGPRGRAPGIGTGQTVLVAEDEPMVRLIVAGTLRDLGFEVLEAGDGAEALAVAAEAPLALLVTDVVMPRMGGRELAARMRDRTPGLRVLFVSGFTDGALGDAGDPETAFLPKPFMAAELADAVRSLLEPEATPAA